MHFRALATDYDGTLACEGRVNSPTITALKRFRASGRHILLVTGREMEDLKRIFSRFDLFDFVVAENGAVLYYPAEDSTKLLHAPVPPGFVPELRARGVEPLSVGQVIVASREPNEKVILQVIKELGLELEIIFNKGAVMVLPAGVNKATGLAAALRDLGVLAANTVGIGDAENDHAFLSLCGCGVAVSNALPSLKKHADLVTRNSHGAGVTELTELVTGTDLAGIECRPRRQTILYENPSVLSGFGPEAGRTP